ncbi:MAG: NAD(P)/FAD-dependent oxidoreductase [Nitrospinota bacterium]
MNRSFPKTHRILILGGGFGGIYAALRLEKAFAREGNVEITLINRDNYLLFSPMLAEVSSSGIEAKHIVPPIRAFFRKVRFRDSQVEAIDLENRVVHAFHCPQCPHYSLEFDHLILALGSVTSFYGLPGVEENALPLKTLADAMGLRNHVIDMLEHADMETDVELRRRLLTIVVAGAGFSGVEVAAELNDFLRGAKRFYANIRPEEVRLALVASGSRILPGLAEDLAAYAQRGLLRRGVEVRLGTGIAQASAGGVDLQDESHIPTRTLVWTAGIAPNPLLAPLSCQKERGRIVVNDRLEVPEYPGLWAIGDCAHLPDPKTGLPYPPTAQHAVRQGRRVADNVVAAIRGRPKKPFAYSSIGELVPLGRRLAVAEILGFKFRGFFAWWLWRTVYLSKLPGFERKIRVALDWTLDLFLPRDIVLLKPFLKMGEEEGMTEKVNMKSSE